MHLQLHLNYKCYTFLEADLLLNENTVLIKCCQCLRLVYFVINLPDAPESSPQIYIRENLLPLNYFQFICTIMHNYLQLTENNHLTWWKNVPLTDTTLDSNRPGWKEKQKIQNFLTVKNYFSSHWKLNKIIGKSLMDFRILINFYITMQTETYAVT